MTVVASIPPKVAEARFRFNTGLGPCATVTPVCQGSPVSPNTQFRSVPTLRYAVYNDTMIRRCVFQELINRVPCIGTHQTASRSEGVTKAQDANTHQFAMHRWRLQPSSRPLTIAGTKPLLKTEWLKGRRVLFRIPFRCYFGELLAVWAPTLISIKLITRCSMSVPSDATVKATSCSKDALFNHIRVMATDHLPPSRGANSAVANGNRRQLRPLRFQRTKSVLQYANRHTAEYLC